MWRIVLLLRFQSNKKGASPWKIYNSKDKLPWGAGHKNTFRANDIFIYKAFSFPSHANAHLLLTHKSLRGALNTFPFSRAIQPKISGNLIKKLSAALIDGTA